MAQITAMDYIEIYLWTGEENGVLECVSVNLSPNPEVREKT